MLGKRFRRTTSMSQLGPGSLIKGPAGDSGRDAAMQGASNLHNFPYKAARPLVVEAHVCAGNEGATEARRGDGEHLTGALQPLGGVVPGALQAQRPWSMGGEWFAVDAVFEEMNVEQVGSKVDEGSAAPFSDSSAAIGRGLAHCFDAIVGAAGAGNGSPSTYQMGLWAESSVYAGQGFAKREQISPVAFLDACFYCKRRLRHERDIFMYRGDTAFCSEECRHRQMVNDERKSAKLSSGKRGGGGGARARSETAVAA